MTTLILRFTSPSGKGVVSAVVHQRGSVEYVEVEVSLLREMLSDLGFVEEYAAYVPTAGDLPLMPEPHDSEPEP